MIGILELILLGAALLVVVRLSKAGKITIHNEKFNRFADHVDERAGNVLWRGPNAQRNSTIAAVIVALLIIAYPTSIGFMMRVTVAVLVVLAVKYWSRSLSSPGEDELQRSAETPQPEPEGRASRAEPQAPQAPGTPRHFSRPIPPIPRLKHREISPAPNTEGFFSVILPAFGILCLIIGGGFALLVASGEISPHVHAQRVHRERVAKDRLITLHEGAPAPQLASSETTTQVDDGVGVIGPDDRIEYQIDRTQVTFLSTLHSKLGEARGEIDQRVAEYLRAAVAFEYAAKDVADWKPSPDWIREHLIVREDKVPHGDAPGYFRLKAVASFDPQHLELASDRYQQDQVTGRTWLLAKTYAGTVSMLGGLAIFLRLGTGVRPGANAGAGDRPRP